MKKREPVSISFCEKCGTKVSSRNELCSNCGVLPYQDDRVFRVEHNIPDELHYDDWSDELYQKFDEWCETTLDILYCKDCGKEMEEVKKYDDDFVNEDTGEVITTNDHPCNPDSPIFE